MTSLKARATESFGRDVADVAGGLASAADVAAFNDVLSELLELASDCRVLVADAGDDRLAVRAASETFLLSVERA